MRDRYVRRTRAWKGLISAGGLIVAACTGEPEATAPGADVGPAAIAHAVIEHTAAPSGEPT